MPTPTLVVIESPFAPGTRINKHYLRACLLDSLSRGEAPYASHGLYPGALDDANPEQREIGMRAGFAWAERASVTAIYFDLGVSGGMARGYAHAVKHERTIVWRSIPAFAGIRRSVVLPWAVRPPAHVKLDT